MEIIPAIYIMDGKCVALYKSSYEQRETYYRDPLEMARSFEKQGAQSLYLVDLDGKRDNTFRQKELFARIGEKVQIPLWIEAGFGNMDDIQAAFDLGCERVVIRPVSTHIIEEAIKKFGADKIAVLIQAKGGGVIGVEKKSYEEAVEVVDYAELLIPLGVKTVVYHDERSEGTLIHPNYDEADRLFQVTGKKLKIYISGGISEAKHLKMLDKIGVAGAIIGKAFYEKILTISEAEEAVAVQD
jgi:phosphoribosylformimino-5-aminoimidazole carboxamide ribotide isomerase